MTYYISDYDSLSVKLAHELLRRLKESHRDGEMQHHLKRFIEDKTMNVIPTADTRDDTCDLTPNDVRKAIAGK